MEQVANLRVVKVLFLFSRWPSIATSTLLLRAVSLSLPPSRWVPDFLLLLLFMLLFLFARRLSQFLPPNTCWQFGRRECRTRLRIFCFPNLSGLRWTCPFSRTLLRWAINVLPVSFQCPSNVPPMSLHYPFNGIPFETSLRIAKRSWMSYWRSILSAPADTRLIRVVTCHQLDLLWLIVGHRWFILPAESRDALPDKHWKWQV